MRALHYQQVSQPFPNPSAPTAPEGWLSCADDRPVPKRWHPSYQEYAGPVFPPQPTSNLAIAEIDAAVAYRDEAPIRRRWHPPEQSETWPLRIGDVRTFVSSVATWFVDDPLPIRVRKIKDDRPGLWGGELAFLPLSPAPDFKLSVQTDQVYYRADQSDYVYLRKTPASFDRNSLPNSGLNGSIGSIVTRGFTSVGSINLVVTAGYGSTGTAQVETDVVYVRADSTDTVYLRK